MKFIRYLFFLLPRDLYRTYLSLRVQECRDAVVAYRAEGNEVRAKKWDKKVKEAEDEFALYDLNHLRDERLKKTKEKIWKGVTLLVVLLTFLGSAGIAVATPVKIYIGDVLHLSDQTTVTVRGIGPGGVLCVRVHDGVGDQTHRHINKKEIKVVCREVKNR
jgi:hypothetical protein